MRPRSRRSVCGDPAPVVPSAGSLVAPHTAEPGEGERPVAVAMVDANRGHSGSLARDTGRVTLGVSSPGLPAGLARRAGELHAAGVAATAAGRPVVGARRLRTG